MNIRTFLTALLVALLGLGFSWRLVSTKEVIFPKNKYIKFAANISAEPKISANKQVIRVGDGWIYADLYPGFTAGEKIIVEGQFDDSGKMFSPKIRLGDGGGSLGFMNGLRLKLRQNIEALLPAREAALVSGMVLGVDRMDRNLKDAFVKTGTIHVVVVSGQNLAIVAGIFLGLATILGRRLSLVLALSASIFYAFLTGFQPPVMRAVLMVASSTLAIFFGRQAHVLWAIFLAALVILFFWPRAIFDVSFQLTFAATAGIATLGQYLAKISNWSRFQEKSKFKISNLLVKNAAIATSAFLFTMPIILYHFGRLSLVSPIANIVVVEAVFPIMVLGFAVAFASLVFMPLAQPIAYLVFVPAFYFVKIVEMFSKFEFAQINFGSGNLALAILLYILIVLMVLIWGLAGKLKIE